MEFPWRSALQPSIFTGHRHEAAEVTVDPALTDRSPTQACSPHVLHFVQSRKDSRFAARFDLRLRRTPGSRLPPRLRRRSETDPLSPIAVIHLGLRGGDRVTREATEWISTNGRVARVTSRRIRRSSSSVLRELLREEGCLDLDDAVALRPRNRSRGPYLPRRCCDERSP